MIWFIRVISLINDYKYRFLNQMSFLQVAEVSWELWSFQELGKISFILVTTAFIRIMAAWYGDVFGIT